MTWMEAWVAMARADTPEPEPEPKPSRNSPLRRSAEAMCHALEAYTFGQGLTQREARELVDQYRKTVKLPPELKSLPDRLA